MLHVGLHFDPGTPLLQQLTHPYFFECTGLHGIPAKVYFVPLLLTVECVQVCFNLAPGLPCCCGIYSSENLQYGSSIVKMHRKELTLPMGVGTATRDDAVVRSPCANCFASYQLEGEKQHS